MLKLLVSLAFIFATAVAQQQPEESQPDSSEGPFLQSAAKELDAYATLAFKNHFPRRAREAWLEVIAEYDRDDEVAREGLGFVRVGTAWQPKPDFQFPKSDELNAASAKMLDAKWKEVSKKLGDGHRQLGDSLTAANKPDRARYHFTRSLRFQPTDAKSQAGVGAKTVEGVTGTELELVLLKRSRMMDKQIAQLSEQTYAVKPSDVKDERLDKAKVTYTAFESPNFVVLGDWEPEVLTEAAQWMERSLAFCEVVFADCEPWKKKPVLTPRVAFFKQRATWADVVRANASSFSDVDFVVKNTSACNIGDGKAGLHLAGVEATANVFDFAVRKVAQEYALVGRDAVVEGVGHAIVGMFFGRNLIVMVAQQKKEGTVAGRDNSRFELPDLETWKDLARELAFEKGTAPAAHLPLVTAAKFTVEERLKAWSFVDYLLRRDPVLMLRLDATAAKARNDFDVMAAFQESTKLSLRGVEDDWRHFYIDDSPALSAIRNKVTPMQAVSKDASDWVEELNRQRRLYGAKDVAWSADLSAPCRQHADYLKQNKGERGPDKENTQVSGKPGYSNTGRLFAATAVIATRDKDPRKAMENWLLMPGYRDVLLDRSLEQVGAYADGAICVLDVIRGRSGKPFSETISFPFINVKVNDKPRYKELVPAAIDIDVLGPEFKALLAHGTPPGGKAPVIPPKQKQVGFPLTCHFFGADQSDVKCDVMADGKTIAGVLSHSTVGSRRIAAPGLWVFLPLEPLPKGDITMIWTIKGRAEQAVTFGTQ